MMKRGQQTFGRAGGKAQISSVAGQRSALRGKSYPMLASETAAPRPAFHGSHLELHWPKYGAVIAGFFASGIYIANGAGKHPLAMLFASVVFAVLSYFALNRFRRMVNAVHMVRTHTFRSPTFAAGAVVGLSYFIYSTFVDPQMIGDVGLVPPVDFQDGFQREDLGSAIWLVIQAVAMMGGVGVLFQMIASRIGGDETEG